MWSLIWPRRPREKFSLENLRYLYDELVTHDVVNESNKETVVEILRSIAELLIWGDQHNDHVFYFFCEKNILSHFLRILSLPLDRQITVQILQTLSIMIQNFNRQTSIFYLLSNNHINALILHRFDFSDEEVIAYYISFLKTLSLKLNRDTLQFFFNREEGTFPLYSQAIQFFHHSEAMVRIAVRTITLNVYKVSEPDLRRFIIDVSAAPYFSNLVWFIRNQIAEVDAMLRQAPNDPGGHELTRLLDIQVDQFHYIMDILRLQIDALNRILVDQLLANFIVPVLLGSLLTPSAITLSPRLALYILFQIFYIFDDKVLVNSTAICLLRSSAESSSSLPAHWSAAATIYEEQIAGWTETNGRSMLTIRSILLKYLSESGLAQFAAALLLAILRNPEIDTDLLVAVNFCPQKTIKKRRLLSSLLSAEPTTPSRSPEPVPRMRQLSNVLESQQLESTYAEDVVDACFEALSADLPHHAAIMVGHLLTELVHVERGGLNDRDSGRLCTLYDAAVARFRQSAKEGDPAQIGSEPSAAQALAALAEPRAILLNNASSSGGAAAVAVAGLQEAIALHRLITLLTSMNVDVPRWTTAP